MSEGAEFGAATGAPHPQPFPRKPRGGREPEWSRSQVTVAQRPVILRPRRAVPARTPRCTGRRILPGALPSRGAAADTRAEAATSGRFESGRRMPREAPPPAPLRMLRMRRGENSCALRLASRTPLREQSAKADFGPSLPRLQSPQQGRWPRLPYPLPRLGLEPSAVRSFGPRGIVYGRGSFAWASGSQAPSPRRHWTQHPGWLRAHHCTCSPRRRTS
jgi:hypothetical protein